MEGRCRVKLRAYSKSALDAYESCLRKAIMDRNGPVRIRKKTPMMEHGTLVHLWMENALLLANEAHSGQLDKEECLSSILATVAPIASRATSKFSRDETLAVCGRVAENFDFFEFVPSSVELKLAFDSEWRVCPWDDPQVRFRCVIDLWLPDGESKGTVIDWKTSKQTTNADFFQLEVYCAILFHLNPSLQTIKAGFEFVAIGESEYQEYSREDLEWVLPELTERMDLLDELLDNVEDPEPTPGWGCSECHHIFSCPIYYASVASAESVMPPRDGLVAFQMKQQSYVLERAVNKMKELFKSYVETYGEVTNYEKPGKVFRQRTTRRLLLDPGRVYLAATEAGIPAEVALKSFSISKANAEELLAAVGLNIEDYGDFKSSVQVRSVNEDR